MSVKKQIAYCSILIATLVLTFHFGFKEAQKVDAHGFQNYYRLGFYIGGNQGYEKGFNQGKISILPQLELADHFAHEKEVEAIREHEEKIAIIAISQKSKEEGLKNLSDLQLLESQKEKENLELKNRLNKVTDEKIVAEKDLDSLHEKIFTWADGSCAISAAYIGAKIKLQTVGLWSGYLHIRLSRTVTLLGAVVPVEETQGHLVFVYEDLQGGDKTI